MNPDKIARIKQFMGDKALSATIKEVLREAYLEDTGVTDVNTLASERIAINKLEKAWKNLEKYKNQDNQEPEEKGNIGL